MRGLRVASIGMFVVGMVLTSASVAFAQSTSEYTMQHFSFSYPSEWKLAPVGAGVSITSPDKRHIVYVESFPAVTFEDGFGCVSYHYDLLRGAWQWSDLGGVYPDCGHSPAPINLRAPTYDLGNGMYAFVPSLTNPRTLIIQSVGQVLRLRAGFIKSTGAIDPEALAIFRTLRTTFK